MCVLMVPLEFQGHVADTMPLNIVHNNVVANTQFVINLEH